MNFTITEQHLKLLNNMYVSWQDTEFGAPEINPKRPYGNSDVYSDIAEILGIKHAIPDDDDPEFSDEQFEMMEKIHKEMEHVLQIICDTLQVSTGEYSKEDYEPWRRV